jgi:hypothetical protein
LFLTPSERRRGKGMKSRFEYRFVILGGSWLGRRGETYRDVVGVFARAGWRLLQVLTPAPRGRGAAERVELVFEREVPRRAAVGKSRIARSDWPWSASRN